MNDVVDNMKYQSVFQYLTHFVIKSFLISVLIFMLFITGIIIFYLFDLFINVNKSEYKAPLFSTYTIVSPSMVPTINVNDAIVVKRIDHDRYRIGDIITFSSSDVNYTGLTITHRIVNKQDFTKGESIYTTKGDANEVVDPSKVTTKSIYGKVLFKIPNIGLLSKMGSNSYIYLFLGIFTILFIIYEIYHRSHRNVQEENFRKFLD